MQFCVLVSAWRVIKRKNVASSCEGSGRGSLGSWQPKTNFPSLSCCFFFGCRSLRTSSAQCPCGIALPFLWNIPFDQPKRQAENQQAESLSLNIHFHLDPLVVAHMMKRHVCSNTDQFYLRFLSECIKSTSIIYCLGVLDLIHVLPFLDFRVFTCHNVRTNIQLKRQVTMYFHINHTSRQNRTYS